MYRPKTYAVDDLALLQSFVRGRSFATLAASLEGRVVLAYAPVVFDTGGAIGNLRFHLACANPLADMPDGTPVTVSILGPDAYISPGWYANEGFVPTWNYSAVEATGTAHRLDDEGLRRLLIDLTAEQETKLAPKQPWTMDKVPEDRLAAMLRAIAGFCVVLQSLEGKFKLSQDKSADDAAGAIAGLEARGDGRAAHIAAAMRRFRKAR